MQASDLVPTRIELRMKSTALKIDWQQGASSEIPFPELRRHCACSFCRKGGRFGEVPSSESVQVKTVVPMGSSGLQVVFDDGHDKGIFPWGYLAAIGEGRGLEYFNESQ